MNTQDTVNSSTHLHLAEWLAAPQVPRHEFRGDYATISPEAWLSGAADDEDVLAAMFGQIASEVKAFAVQTRAHRQRGFARFCGHST